MRRDTGAADLERKRLAIDAGPLRKPDFFARGGARKLPESVRDVVRERAVEKVGDPDAEAAATRTPERLPGSRLEVVAPPRRETAR